MTCHCFIRHSVTPDERKIVAHRLEEARRIGDTNGIIIALAMLDRCPTQNDEEKRNENE